MEIKKTQCTDTVTDEPKPEKLPSFIELSKQWFKNGKIRWSEFTQERYETVLRLHVRPAPLFSRPVDKTKRTEVRAFLLKLSRKRSPAFIETIHGVISGIFNEAIEQELINANPASALLKTILPPLSKRDLKRADPLTQEELNHFMAHAQKIGSWAELLILKMMAYAGLRLGEAPAMRREYLDTKNRTYFVCQSFNRRQFNRPKHGKRRLIDLPDFLMDELETYIGHLKKERLRTGSGGKINLLFIDPAEKRPLPYSQRKIQYLMKKVSKAAGLRIRNPHDLRHTYATLVLMSHMSPGYVQKQLGHSSISITMDIYCHWIPTQGRQGLEAAFGEGAVVPDRDGQPHIIAYQKKRASVKH